MISPKRAYRFALTDDDIPEKKVVTKKNAYEMAKNDFDVAGQEQLKTQQAALQNAIIRIESDVVNDILNHISKNKFDDEDEVIDKAKREAAERELNTILQSFYSVLLPLMANRVLNKRSRDYNIRSMSFQMNQVVKNFISGISSKVAKSHITTIVEDVRDTIKNTYEDNYRKEVEQIAMKKSPSLQITPEQDLPSIERLVTDDDLVYARKRALQGASQQRILNEVKNKYRVISDVRAKAIARTEMNRAFTQSQYQADLQFLTDNGLIDKAYKQWTTRSDNPCPVCQALSNQKPIPFTNNFADLGDLLEASYSNNKGQMKVQKVLINFEPLDAGNAHVNCSCIYVLILK